MFHGKQQETHKGESSLRGAERGSGARVEGD